jgi:phage tail-like protein
MIPSLRTGADLPPFLGPPNDPTWLLMSPWQGWRMSAGSQGVEVGTALTLAPVPGTGRTLAEPSGSFGGLVPPGNVAVGSDDTVILLDGVRGRFRLFDECACRFVDLPCRLAPRASSGDPDDISRINIRGNDLYVCDWEGHRILVLALPSLTLRRLWSVPASATLPNAWQPFSIGFGAGGAVYVSDRANGLIHRFTARGQSKPPIAGLGAPRDLVVDCAGRILVRTAGVTSNIRVFDADGVELAQPWRPADLAEPFPRLPFTVDERGALDFGEHCGVFDSGGESTNRLDAPSLVRYLTSGTYLSGPLDSAIYRCQWHRLVLSGDLPGSASIDCATYTSEVEEPPDRIQNLPPGPWLPAATAGRMDGGRWDALIRSGPGRFLWLLLTLRGNGATTPRLDSIRIDYPRVSLGRYLPAAFAMDPNGADFTDRFLSLFDTTLRSVEEIVDHEARFLDPRSTPAGECGAPDMLAWLAGWIGISLDRHWDVGLRRRFVRLAARTLDRRGTKAGLRALLGAYLGFDAAGECCPRPTLDPCACHRNSECRTVAVRAQAWEPPPLLLEHFQLRRWLFVGGGRLGDQAVLWGKRIVNRTQLDTGSRADSTKLVMTPDPYHDPFGVYASRYSVFVPAAIRRSAARQRGLENLLRSETPAHARYQVEYVEPRFRIGIQSMIGYDAVIGRYPAGMVLEAARLGQATVLGGAPDLRPGPEMSIGRRTRVGETTRLT